MLVLEKDGLAEVRKNAVGECPALRLILHLKIATEKNRVFCRIQCYLQAERQFRGSFFGIDPKKFRVNRRGPPKMTPGPPGWVSENAPPYV